MSDPNDALLKSLADEDFKQQAIISRQQQIQLHKADILKAKLPTLFSQLKAAVRERSLKYDQFVQEKGGASSTSSVEKGELTQETVHRGPAMNSTVTLTLNLSQQSISFDGLQQMNEGQGRADIRGECFDIYVSTVDELVFKPRGQQSLNQITVNSIADQIVSSLVRPL